MLHIITSMDNRKTLSRLQAPQCRDERLDSLGVAFLPSKTIKIRFYKLLTVNYKSHHSLK